MAEPSQGFTQADTSLNRWYKCTGVLLYYYNHIIRYELLVCQHLTIRARQYKRQKYLNFRMYFHIFFKYEKIFCRVQVKHQSSYFLSLTTEHHVEPFHF